MTGWKPIPRLVLLALLIRGGFAAATIDNLRADPDAYALIARGIAAGGGVSVIDADGQTRPTAFRPPAYPWLLSWLVIDGRLWLAGVAGLHVLLAVVTAGLTFDVAARIGGRRSGWIAAGLVTAEPLLLWSSTLVMTEVLAAALSMGVWWIWMGGKFSEDPSPPDPLSPKRGEGEKELGTDPLSPRRGEGEKELGTDPLSPRRGEGESTVAEVAKTFGSAGAQPKVLATFATPIPGGVAALGLGCVLAIAFLCRPVMIVWAVLLLGGGWVRPPRATGRWAIAMAASIVVIVVGGWTLRNRAVVGHPVWATTHGGYTLLLGNNELFYDDLSRRWSEPWTVASWLPWRRQPWDATEFLEQYAASINAANTPAGEYAVAEAEWEQDRQAGAMARATIAGRPVVFIAACADRVVRLWHPFAMQTGQRSTGVIVAAGLFETVFLSLAIVGGWRLVVARRWAWLWPPLTLVISLTLVHAVYWSNPRMRAPAVPALAVLAASTRRPLR